MSWVKFKVECASSNLSTVVPSVIIITIFRSSFVHYNSLHHWCFTTSTNSWMRRLWTTFVVWKKSGLTEICFSLF
jgi:hypothetical protein